MLLARDDLLRLTPQAIAAAANMGLLKRAQKDLEEGRAPELETAADGKVIAIFPDGARASLPPGKALKDCPCTCGATTVCRHRVGAILAYQRVMASSQNALEAQAGPVEVTGTVASWTPANVDDAALETLLGRGALERASALRRRGVLIEVTLGSFVGDSLPQAQLATSTVRFLVPGDISYARCDCRAKSGCEHVALAVWAFRAAAAKDPGAARVTVELGEPVAGADERCALALEATRSVAAMVLIEGASRLPAAAASRFALGRAALERGKAAWPLGAVEDLEELVAAYHRRSARYSPDHLAGVLVDLWARCRAASGHGDMPAGAVLGTDETPEAALDQVRLVAIGARVEADDENRDVEVLLADPSSASVLVLRRHFAPQPGSGQDGSALGRRPGIAGVPIGMLAASQIVSNAAVRRPNRSISFSVGALKKTSVLSGGATLASVPGALLVKDTQEFAQELARRAPRVVRPRLLAENTRVFTVSGVEEMVFDEADQALRAHCRDGAGHPFTVERRHRSVAPGALHSLAQLLASNSIAAITGDGHRRGPFLVVDAISAWADRQVVLDFAESTPEGAEALASVPHGNPTRANDPLSIAVDTARSLLAEAAHHGLRASGPAWIARLRSTRGRLLDLGLASTAGHFEVLEHATLAASATGTNDDEAVAAEQWATAALRLELLASRV